MRGENDGLYMLLAVRCYQTKSDKAGAAAGRFTAEGKTISAREREIERKELARQKYCLGALILLAQAKIGGTLSDEFLLGALLQIYNEQESDRLRSWGRYGAGLLKTQRQEVKESAAAQDFPQAEVKAE